MSLLFVRTTGAEIIGEILTPSSVLEKNDGLTLLHPMKIETFTVQQPARIAGQPPQQITAFRLVPIPCERIVVYDVAFSGIVKPKNPLAVTYQQVLESLQKAESSPMMITQ